MSGYQIDSELIVNEDGSIFHLHLKNEDLAPNVILVGDPARVDMIGDFLDVVEQKKQSREFCSITGWFKEKRFTILSTGIGPDNIDIVMNELHALATINLQTREELEEKTKLSIVRIGTCGSLQAGFDVGTYLLSKVHIGCDGVLHFYEGSEQIRDIDFEQHLIDYCQWNSNCARPYVVYPSASLIEELSSEHTKLAATMTTVGFYGPQGRILTLGLAMEGINERLTDFRYNETLIGNYEMESATIAGLSKLMGHDAATICLVIANRKSGNALANYHTKMYELIDYVLKQLTRK